MEDSIYIWVAGMWLSIFGQHRDSRDTCRGWRASKLLRHCDKLRSCGVAPMSQHVNKTAWWWYNTLYTSSTHVCTFLQTYIGAEKCTFIIIVIVIKGLFRKKFSVEGTKNIPTVIYRVPIQILRIQLEIPIFDF